MIRQKVKKLLKGTPLENVARSAWRVIGGGGYSEWTTSAEYWEKRYIEGGNSGAGSYGRLARYKAEFLNNFVADKAISSVIEFGSGDGNQLSYARYPSYLGVDVSETAILACRERFSEDTSKTFVSVSEYSGQTAELALSLDVIYHLVEDEAFAVYMKTLFDAANRFVIIYSSNMNEQPSSYHVRHRKFTDWVEENRRDFRYISKIKKKFPFDINNPENTSFADFYIFERLG